MIERATSATVTVSYPRSRNSRAATSAILARVRGRLGQTIVQLDNGKRLDEEGLA